MSDKKPSLYTRVGGYDAIRHMAGFALKRAIQNEVSRPFLGPHH